MQRCLSRMSDTWNAALLPLLRSLFRQCICGPFTLSGSVSQVCKIAVPLCQPLGWQPSVLSTPSALQFSPARVQDPLCWPPVQPSPERDLHTPRSLNTLVCPLNRSCASACPGDPSLTALSLFRSRILSAFWIACCIMKHAVLLAGRHLLHLLETAAPHHTARRTDICQRASQPCTMSSRRAPGLKSLGSEAVSPVP